MTYVDTTLTPEAGYTYVNLRQMYDVVATSMTTHPAWDFVESVDAINVSIAYRRYVWKCKTPENGLTYDFFVVFEVPYTVTGTVWATSGNNHIFAGETYAAGVLGKFCTNQNSVTLAADLTNPATFPLATYGYPSTLLSANCTCAWGSNSQATSLRFFSLVAKDVIMMNQASGTGNFPVPTSMVYVGAYESALSPAQDPVQLVVNSTQVTITYSGGASRAPLMTPSTAYTEVFAVCDFVYADGTARIMGNTSQWVMPGPWITNNTSFFGIIGTASTSWYKQFGGPVAAKLAIGPAINASTISTKGVIRGWYKYVCGAGLPSHSPGDTFLVDGRVHVGLGNTAGALIDTEAV